MPEPELQPDETCDPLSRTLRIIQRRRGHRATSDDTLLAWAGVDAAPDARRVLDLGTGKGTVAMLVLSALPEARCVGVEAFEASHALALRNARLNRLSSRFSPILQDLRDFDSAERFDLVLGAPPFMRVGHGVLPADPQRAAGRFELRGGVEAYAVCAARHVADDGAVVLLMDGAGDARCGAALRAAGLHPSRRTRVCPRPGRPATYAIWRARPSPTAFTDDTLAMRDALGERWSADYREVRRRLDLA